MRSASPLFLLLLASCLATVRAFALPAAARPSSSARPLAPARCAHRTSRIALADSGGGFLSGLLPKPKAEEVAEASKAGGKEEEEEEGMTLEKVASFGIAGIISIAIAETVFWVLSFPTSELLYYLGTGEWIDIFTQEGQIKFLAFTAGWGALGGVIAQYRTVLTAAAMTPWVDANIVKPYINPLLGKEEA